MDADWSVEIGQGLPAIEVPWEGWLDLRDPATSAARLRKLPEAAAYPELASVLLELNAAHPAAFTSKCDVFPVDASGYASSMMDEPVAGERDELRFGLGSYIDLACSIQAVSSSLPWWESLARRVASDRLAPILIPRASVELVIRQASLFAVPGFAVTIYATGFGRDQTAARSAWAYAMRLAASFTLLEVTSRLAAGLP